MHAFFANHITQGVITGIVAAAAVDIHAFFSWKNAHDAATYDWSVAIWRWFQGAVAGLVTSLGYGALAS